MLNQIFLLFLMFSTLISISSSSWLTMWLGLEMNMMSFIPMMMKKHSIQETEASLKYFLIQTFTSLMLLTSTILLSMKLSKMMFMESKTLLTITLLSLTTKLGLAPFHFWFPMVMEGISWMNCLILSVWQKISPLILMTYMIPQKNELLMYIIMLSLMISTMGGINQNLLRKIMAFSSINHMSWLLSNMMVSESTWQMYFIMYSLLNMSVMLPFKQMNTFHINNISINKQEKTKSILMFLPIMSLAGLPPLMGFFPKWSTIIITLNWNMTMLPIMLLLSSMISIYFYMRMMFSKLLQSNISQKWNYYKNLKMNMLILSSIINLPISPLILTMQF